MDAPVLVTGGTGTLGKLVVARLRDANRQVRVLSRRADASGDGIERVTGDLTTGAGIDRAVEGVDTIVHCAGTSKGDDAKARTLVTEAARAGVGHVVNISVVGADRIPVTSAADRAMFAYFASKRAAEDVIAESSVPWTTLRATQFYDLMLTVVRALTRLPVVPVPAGFRFQPIEAAEVADRLVVLAARPPAGLVPDVAGPRTYDTRELVRSYLRATGQRRPVVSVPLPGGAARAIRAGATLAPDHAVGRRTWEEFLAERVPPRAAVAAAGDRPAR